MHERTPARTSMQIGDSTQIGDSAPARALHHDWFAVSMLVFVLLATAGLLAFDIHETFSRDRAASELTRRTGPVVTRPPADGDQVRPYLERGRPVAPGRLAAPARKVPRYRKPRR